MDVCSLVPHHHESEEEKLRKDVHRLEARLLAEHDELKRIQSLLETTVVPVLEFYAQFANGSLAVRTLRLLKG